MTVTAAITIRPPWSLAVTAGVKLIENRGRPTSHRGPVAIHAAATWSKNGAATWSKNGAADQRIRDWWLGRSTAAHTPALDAADIGGQHHFRHIVAVADLVDCHQAHTGTWVTCCAPWGDADYLGGPCWHLVFANVRRLDEPVRAVGRLSVPWQMPADVADQVNAQFAVEASHV